MAPTPKPEWPQLGIQIDRVFELYRCPRIPQTMSSTNKQVFKMQTYPDSIRTGSTCPDSTRPLNMGIPVAEFLHDIRTNSQAQPNDAYGYNRVVKVTRLPHELLTLRQSLSLDGLFQVRIWKHAVLEYCGTSSSLLFSNCEVADVLV